MQAIIAIVVTVVAIPVVGYILYLLFKHGETIGEVLQALGGLAVLVLGVVGGILLIVNAIQTDSVGYAVGGTILLVISGLLLLGWAYVIISGK